MVLEATAYVSDRVSQIRKSVDLLQADIADMRYSLEGMGKELHDVYEALQVLQTEQAKIRETLLVSVLSREYRRTLSSIMMHLAYYPC